MASSISQGDKSRTKVAELVKLHSKSDFRKSNKSNRFFVANFEAKALTNAEALQGVDAEFRATHELVERTNDGDKLMMYAKRSGDLWKEQTRLSNLQLSAGWSDYRASKSILDAAADLKKIGQEIDDNIADLTLAAGAVDAIKGFLGALP
ncbi:hypothetical protein [Rhizobium tubonense]|uniref:Uncharacterized protein n=1 Tax=Rhizobium tubonense TaxID=484088 RepID=A0A2W4CAD4_9HYPH|nr:hypothetical protein [Rhizobium tubonense]PZM07955.1 hypothetical protein CPY51_29790 [Rhizobium tubonense]